MLPAPPTADFSPTHPNGSYTYADYLTWCYPPYVEVIRGWASIRPTPWTRHQQCLGNLLFQLTTFLRQRPHPAQACMGPLDVRLAATSRHDTQTATVVLPDLFVVLNPRQMDEIGCVGAPDWIIEIVSPGTITRDTRTKFDLYAESGVAEYWILYPGEQIITAFVLKGNEYELAGEYYEPGPVLNHTLPELRLEWADVFADLLAAVTQVGATSLA